MNFFVLTKKKHRFLPSLWCGTLYCSILFIIISNPVLFGICSLYPRIQYHSIVYPGSYQQES